MRVMVDTNILISALLFPDSRPSQALWLLAERHHVVICSYIIDELRRIFQRKFPDRTTVLETFLSNFAFEIVHTPLNFDEVAYPLVRDKADLPILVSALQGDVDVMITGDKDLLEVEVERPEIIRVTEFLTRFNTTPE